VESNLTTKLEADQYQNEINNALKTKNALKDEVKVNLNFFTIFYLIIKIHFI
jgi:hypothetical protein